MLSSAWPRITIESLIASGAIVAHKDGNYGSLYPRVEEFTSAGVPFLTAKSLDRGKIDVEGAPRLADERADTLRFGFVRPNDVLLSHNATVGRVAVVPQFDGRLLVGTSLTYFRLNPQSLLPRYFAAYLAGADFQNQLAAVMSHSTRNQVPITAQRALSVVVPPLDVQHMIAGTLGSLDDKIEQNRRTGRALEGLARATFKAWFVDFEPVKAKAAGYTSFPGMPAAIFDTLPTRVVDSELVPVPDGWSIGKLGDVLKLRGERVSPSDETVRLPYVPIDCITSGEITLKDFKDGEEAKSSLVRFKPGDVLFGAMRPYFHKVCLAPFEGTTRTTCFVLTPSPEDRSFALLLASEASTIEYATNHSVGSTIPYAKWEDSLADMACVLPPSATRSAFGSAVDPLLKLANGLPNESRMLARLRDYLLPRLLSGEVRVNK